MNIKHMKAQSMPVIFKRSRIIAIFAAGLALSVAACTLPSSQAAAKGGCAAGADKGSSIGGLSQVTLCIKSGAKTRSFTAEVAASPKQQAQGLMFRQEIADDEGMIFPFPELRVASFWMKNTVIPLDIIFIKANGSIESIAENTTPYSTDSVTAGAPVAAVLELRGGLTSELGIKAGDIITWKQK